MVRRVLPIVIAAVATACADNPDRASVDEDDIIGGRHAEIEDNPWQVALMQRGATSQDCGGSIVDASWVLTANHCVEGERPEGPVALEVIAGRTILDTSVGQVRRVTKVVSFPGFVAPHRGKDVALLKVSPPFDLSTSTVRAIALVTQRDADAGLTEPGTKARTSGWGYVSELGGRSVRLRSVVVPIVSREEVERAYGTGIGNDQIGAGDLRRGGKDACQHDSGGPLVVADGSTPKLAGVVSWGDGCAHRGIPGMYARVSSFAEWIEQTTGRTSLREP